MMRFFLRQYTTNMCETHNLLSAQDDLSHVTRKSVFGGLPPGKTQTGLLSYRS